MGDRAMKVREWLEKWDMASLKINLKFLEMEWKPKEADKDAAWELYIELITRISTQHLAPEHGDEKAALESIHALFPLTREILKAHKRDCMEFTKVAVIVLNQVVRPFTARWHRESLKDSFSNDDKCAEFRIELAELQMKLINYTRMLAGMAEVEDLTAL